MLIALVWGSLISLSISEAVDEVLWWPSLGHMSTLWHFLTHPVEWREQLLKGIEILSPQDGEDGTKTKAVFYAQASHLRNGTISSCSRGDCIGSMLSRMLKHY